VIDFTPIAEKLGSFIRLLASDRDGEVIATVRALIRTLQNAGSDLHELADLVERADGKLNETEMKQIYDAGVAAGMKRAGANGHAQPGGKLPSAYEMAKWCEEHRVNLHRDKDRDFVHDMLGFARRRTLSPKQLQWLENLYLKTGGRLYQ
jgi:hypothetical protein